MRVLRGVLALLLALSWALPASATPPTFHGILGWVGTPNPNCATATCVFSGDSITWGAGIDNQTSSGCTKDTFPSPCFADQVASHYGATSRSQLVNDGVPGSCLETSNVANSPCNPTSGATPLISRYTTTMLPYCGANSNWIFIMIGVNDARGLNIYNDTNVSVGTYKSNLQTVVSACENAGTPGNQIVLSQITYDTSSVNDFPTTLSFDAAIAEVAIQYGTRLPTTMRATAYCVSTCLYDGLHPNNTGHANVASEIENATFLNAIGGLPGYYPSGYIQSGWSAHTSTTSVAGITCSLQGFITTGGSYKACIDTGGNNGWAGSTSASNYYLSSSTSTPVISSSGINANPTNLSRGNSSALNPTIDVYNGGTSNHWGSTLYSDGTGLSLGWYTPNGLPSYGGFSWLTFTNGTFPTLQSGFSRIAFLSPAGNLWTLGTLQWGGSSGPTLNSGSGAPTGACTAGAIYTRTDSSAAAGSEMYVCRNVAGTRTWMAVSGG